MVEQCEKKTNTKNDMNKTEELFQKGMMKLSIQILRILIPDMVIIVQKSGHCNGVF